MTKTTFIPDREPRINSCVRIGMFLWGFTLSALPYIICFGAGLLLSKLI